MTLSTDQEYALDQIKNSSHKMFFVTGDAGTGKSFVISKLRNTKLCAPTGVAAQLIGGCTIHRLLGIRPDAKFANPKTLFKRIKSCDYLVVDEVSMVGFELFNMLITAYHICGWRGKIIFVGDFAQLPPVRDQPCFQHMEWNKVKTLKLTTNHRQADPEFVKFLNYIRSAETNDFVKNYLRERLDTPCPGRIYLASRTHQVGEINAQRITEALADGRVFRDYSSSVRSLSQYWPEKKCVDDIIKNGRTMYAIRLFEGARVMVTRNESTYVNGTLGSVIGFDDSVVAVKGDDGILHHVKRIDHEVYDGEGRVLYIQNQFPLAYGYAITLHKSQGTTLAQAHVELDGIFTDGQAYVGFSRLSSGSGLTVSGDIDNLYLSVLPNIPN